MLKISTLFAKLFINHLPNLFHKGCHQMSRLCYDKDDHAKHTNLPYWNVHIAGSPSQKRRIWVVEAMGPYLYTEIKPRHFSTTAKNEIGNSTTMWLQNLDSLWIYSKATNLSKPFAKSSSIISWLPISITTMSASNILDTPHFPKSNMHFKFNITTKQVKVYLTWPAWKRPKSLSSAFLHIDHHPQHNRPILTIIYKHHE